MEQQNSDLFSDEIKIDETAKNHILGLASWAMLIVIVSVLGYVLDLLDAFTGRNEGAVQSEGFGVYFTTGGNSIGGAILSLLIGLLINFFLFRFAKQSRSGITALNQDELNRSFRNLKIYFIIISILMIIVSLIVLIGVFAIL